jgi:hypothetical protein
MGRPSHEILRRALTVLIGCCGKTNRLTLEAAEGAQQTSDEPVLRRAPTDRIVRRLIGRLALSSMEFELS